MTSRSSCRCGWSIAGAKARRCAPAAANAERRWRHEPRTCAPAAPSRRSTAAGWWPPAARRRRRATRGVYLLLDTSGTYAQELDKAKQIINYTLSRLDALRFVRGGAHRHRQLQRAGHHRQGHLRRPSERRQSTEARVRGKHRALRSRQSRLRRIPTSQAGFCRRSSSSTRRNRDEKRS